MHTTKNLSNLWRFIAFKKTLSLKILHSFFNKANFFKLNICNEISNSPTTRVLYEFFVALERKRMNYR